MIDPKHWTTGPIWLPADLGTVRIAEIAKRVGAPLRDHEALLSTIGEELDRGGWAWRLQHVDQYGDEDYSRVPGWVAAVARPYPPPFAGDFRSYHRSQDESVALTMAALDAFLFDHAARREPRRVHQIAPPTTTLGGIGHLAILGSEPPELSARYGLVFEDGCDYLDYFRSAAIRLTPDHWVVLRSYLRNPDPGTEAITDAAFDAGAVARQLFAELGLSKNEILWSGAESASR